MIRSANISLCSGGHQMLGHHWTKAEATIIAKEPRPMTGGYQQTYNYVVDVQRVDGPPIRATIHEGFRAPDGGFADPAIGAVIGVLYDKNSEVKFDVDDPRLSLGDGKNAAAAAFAAAANAAPGTPPPVAPPSAGSVHTIDLRGSTDPADRLAKLDALRASGVLDEASYQSARSAIVGPQ
jgi:hypothetical protein